jgi:hypothetical protein
MQKPPSNPPTPGDDEAGQLPDLTDRLAGCEGWVRRILSHQQPLVRVGFGATMIERWQPRSPVGEWAGEVARRFAVGTSGAKADPLVLSPYAPPQRQISSARQGAAEWPHGEGRASSADRPSDLPAILQDLMNQGWKNRP